MARTGLDFTSTSADPLTPIRLVAVLVLAVLPAGILAGRLLGRLAVCRAGVNNPDKPD